LHKIIVQAGSEDDIEDEYKKTNGCTTKETRRAREGKRKREIRKRKIIG